MSLCTLTLKGSGSALVPANTTLTIPEEVCATLDIKVTTNLPQTLAISKEEGGEAFTPSLVSHLKIRSRLSDKWITASSATAATTVHLNSSSSIQRALNEAPVGSTVLVAPGRYFETLQITKPVNLRGSGPADGTKLFGSIWVSSTSHVTVDGVSIYPLDYPSAGLRVTLSADVFVQNCIIAQDQSQKFLLLRRNASGIHVSHSSGIHFTNNILHGYGFGLYLDECRSCVVQSSVFRGCWNALGVARCEGLRLTGNRFRENMAVWLSLGGGAGGGPVGLVANGNVFEDNVEDFVIGSDGVGGVTGGFFSLPQDSGSEYSIRLGKEGRLRNGGGPDDDGASERKVAKVVMRGICAASDAKDLKKPEFCASIQGTDFFKLLPTFRYNGYKLLSSSSLYLSITGVVR